MATRVNAASESIYFENISATTAAFTLKGGLYGFTASATWGGGSVTLQKLAADGSTYVTALTAVTANGFVTVHLPPGTYRFSVATASAIYLDLTAIARGS